MASPVGKPLLQIAPMMDVTYKDFRQFMRLLSKQAQLWTEMHVAGTLCHAEWIDGFMEYEENEHPIVLQLGGSHAGELATAAKLAAQWGYDEVNLNCGCPSDRVAGHGEFGASLMKQPQLVRECVTSMMDALGAKPKVTVKCRLGVDDFDSRSFTIAFVREVAEAGVDHFIIHARKCWLQGLTPEQNRKVPPLMYHRVLELCEEFPELSFTLNGGVVNLEQVKYILDAAPANLAGVMIGRAALDNPCMLADCDRYIFKQASNPATALTRESLLIAYAAYLQETYPPESSAATSSGSGGAQMALKPILGLFHGTTGSKLLRRSVNELSHDPSARRLGIGELLRRIIARLRDDPLAREHLLEPLPHAGSNWPPTLAAALADTS